MSADLRLPHTSSASTSNTEIETARVAPPTPLVKGGRPVSGSTPSSKTDSPRHTEVPDATDSQRLLLLRAIRDPELESDARSCLLEQYSPHTAAYPDAHPYTSLARTKLDRNRAKATGESLNRRPTGDGGIRPDDALASQSSRAPSFQLSTKDKPEGRISSDLLLTTTTTPIFSTTRSSVVDDHLPMPPSLPFPINRSARLRVVYVVRAKLDRDSGRDRTKTTVDSQNSATDQGRKNSIDDAAPACQSSRPPSTQRLPLDAASAIYTTQADARHSK
ncbi:hypothetical protein B0H14DRAFT_3435271 [Mycena olivaceomarginata]|nr:hypothetical protein B0H14DRAFT_3435271 [Mycena olivaceomarginata]